MGLNGITWQWMYIVKIIFMILRALDNISLHVIKFPIGGENPTKLGKGNLTSILDFGRHIGL